jgi:hypothetical protein
MERAGRQAVRATPKAPPAQAQEPKPRPPVESHAAPVAFEFAHVPPYPDGEPLPHLAQLQRAFAPHDLSAVRAHVGPAASERAQLLHACAFTTGGQVVFDGPPSLRTAAHEAAHIVQQRTGVQSGERGRRGDLWERHADAVADRVVYGRSAAELLAAAPARAPALQLEEASAPTPGGLLVDVALLATIKHLDELIGWAKTPLGFARVAVVGLERNN